MRKRNLFVRILAVTLVAAILPQPQAFASAGEAVAEESGKAATVSENALPQPAYFWDFEDAGGSSLNNQGTAGGAAVLHGADMAKSAIAIGSNSYAGDNNSVLSLKGGEKGTSYVELPGNLYKGVSADTGLTWAFWMKPDAGIVSYSRLFSSIGSSNRGEFAYAPFAQDKQWNLIFDDDSIYRQIYGKEPEKGVWSYITVTVSKNGAEFYINGEKCSSSIIAGNASFLANKLNDLASFNSHALGKTTSRWTDKDCAVQLDDVALYHTALTAVQAADLARSHGLQPEGPRVPQDAQEGLYGTQKKQLFQERELTATSPEGNNQVKIWKDDEDKYYYSVSRNGKTVIECSALGITTKDADLVSGMELDASSVSERTGTEEYEILQGSSSKVNKKYTEESFDLTKDNSRVTVYFRIFEDGIAYRYEVDADTTSHTEMTKVTGEASEFVLPDKGDIWTIPVSPTYEGTEYTKRTMDEQYDSEQKYSTPILASLSEDSGNAWVLLTESNVYNEEKPYCGSVFQTMEGDKAMKVVFGSYLKQETDESLDGNTYSASYGDIAEVSMQDVFHTPWRTAVIASDLEGIANSSLITDLNPSPEGDFSWVEPGASVWSWWSSSYDAIEYKTMQDYIDFAAEIGMKYCLVDYGWELWEDYQTKIANLVEYAEEKNVSILVWYGVNKFDGKHIFDLDSRESIEEQFAWCEEVGVKGVKVDYINSASPFAMRVMYDLADIAAKHHLVLNYHGCINPGGENRTYPNIISSEAVAGMENFKWNNGPSAACMLTLPYTRNVLGSMEFTPTAYREKNSNVTSGFMLAQAVAYESALQSFAHSAYVYQGYDGLSLISEVPTTWDESRLLQGYPGESVVRARRKGKNWYLGAMTLQAKTYDVPLDFLDKGATYHAYIYKDNAAGDNIEIESLDVTSETVLKLPLLANGGCSVKFSQTDILRRTPYDNYNYYEAEDSEYAELDGPAVIEENQYVSNWKVVGYIGKTGILTFQNIRVRSAGEYELKVYYVTGENRDLSICVNEWDVIEQKALLGYAKDWKAVAAITVPVQLRAGNNTIRFYNDSGVAPSIDRIAVSKWSSGSKDLSGAQVRLSQETYTHNGQECRPGVQVFWDGEELMQGVDFTLSYENNINEGTAYAVITGTGYFSGTVRKPFQIRKPEVSGKKQASITGTSKYNKAYGAKPFSLKVSSTAGNAGTLTYSTDNGKVAQVSANGRVTIKSTGIAVITVQLVSNEYEAQDYKVKIEVKPSKVTLSRVKSNKKKQVSATWKKLSSKQGITGYRIAYATNRKFKSYKKMDVKKNKKSAVLKKLKSRKKYYVRVCAYKSVGKTKLYGAWSKVKQVKVK